MSVRQSPSLIADGTEWYGAEPVFRESRSPLEDEPSLDRRRTQANGSKESAGAALQPVLTDTVGNKKARKRSTAYGLFCFS